MATTLYTKAQFRDQVRRILLQVPPVDAGGLPGQQPSAFPWPSNQQINDSIDQSISWINTRTGWNTAYTDLVVTQSEVGQSTQIGPLALSLQQATLLDPNWSALGLINQVKHAYWTPTDGTTPYRLLPGSMEEWNTSARRYDWRGTIAGYPKWYWVEGNNLNILPWPTITGTVELLAGMGLGGFANDSDTMSELPNDYQNVVLYQTVYLVCAANAQDSEAQSRAQTYYGMATAGISDLKAWQQGKDMDDFQPTLALGSNYRRAYGTMRVRR